MIGASNATADEVARLRRIAGLAVYVRGRDGVTEEPASADHFDETLAAVKQGTDPDCPVCNEGAATATLRFDAVDDDIDDDELTPVINDDNTDDKLMVVIDNNNGNV